MFYIIDDLLEDRVDICTCDKCRMDIAALTLNNLEPRYVVTEKGSLYAKLDTLDYQFDVDVVKEVTKAIAKVANNPRHK